MATGMSSSASALRAAALSSSSQPTIRAGEAVSSSASALADPKAKTFRHMIPGAQFIMPDGLSLKFTGGVYCTADDVEIAELSAVANKATSMIYTDKAVKAAVETQVAAAAKDAADTAGTVTG